MKINGFYKIIHLVTSHLKSFMVMELRKFNQMYLTKQMRKSLILHVQHVH